MSDPDRQLRAPTGAAWSDELARIEEVAVDAARLAGALISDRFGGWIEVSSKDDGRWDAVTDVDRDAQRLIGGVIAESFPDHLVIGEEDPSAEETAAPDWVWAVDPIDGTTNFANGLPIHASSIGSLYRGAPVAGAIWIAWPGPSGGVVFRARRGGGAWRDEKRLELSASSSNGVPAAGRPVALPSGLNRQYRLGKELSRAQGDARTMGSVAFEMCMVAAGVAQYAVSGPARLWDFAAGSVIVSEAGGRVAALRRDGRWRELDSFVDGYSADAETSERLRRWNRPVISGPPGAVELLGRNLRPRRPSPLARSRRAIERAFGRREGTGKRS